jgi:hypothetical protein
MHASGTRAHLGVVLLRFRSEDRVLQPPFVRDLDGRRAGHGVRLGVGRQQHNQRACMHQGRVCMRARIRGPGARGCAHAPQARALTQRPDVGQRPVRHAQQVGWLERGWQHEPRSSWLPPSVPRLDPRAPPCALSLNFGRTINLSTKKPIPDPSSHIFDPHPARSCRGASCQQRAAGRAAGAWAAPEPAVACTRSPAPPCRFQGLGF